jgi:hypothetical protein
MLTVDKHSIMDFDVGWSGPAFDNRFKKYFLQEVNPLF